MHYTYLSNNKIVSMTLSLSLQFIIYSVVIYLIVVVGYMRCDIWWCVCVILLRLCCKRKHSKTSRIMYTCIQCHPICDMCVVTHHMMMAKRASLWYIYIKYIYDVCACVFFVSDIHIAHCEVRRPWLDCCIYKHERSR